MFAWARALAGLAGLLVAATPPAAPAERPAEVADVLAAYSHAIADPGAPELAHVQVSGTVSGAGLTGTFHSWSESARERTDQNLGPRTERTVRVGSRFWYADADGDAREFTGELARRARTQHFIDSGEFSKRPERCVLHGLTDLLGHPAYVLDVSADDGDVETLYLDSATGLPARIAYDDDDGRTTIDFSDWRSVAGHRFAFRGVASDGDRAFDTIQTTAAVDAQSAIDPAVFSPPVQRAIDMPQPDTIPLAWFEGHAYAAVRIGGRNYTFLIDTGAQNILLDKHVAGDLGLTPIGAFEASGAKRTGGLQVVTLDEIAIGRGRLRDIVATTLDLRASTAGAFRIDGILGYPFFAAAQVRLDAAHRTLTFGPPGSLETPGERIPLVVDRAFPEALFRLNSIADGAFIVDTGNGAEVLLYKPFVDKHPGIVPFTLSTRHSFGVGGSALSYRTSLDRLDLGTFALYHADADVMQATRGAFADRFDAGNVGLGVLRNFVVTFDEANAAMYLEKGADFDDGRARV